MWLNRWNYVGGRKRSWLEKHLIIIIFVLAAISAFSGILLIWQLHKALQLFRAGGVLFLGL